MTKDEFINAIQRVVYKTGIEGTIEQIQKPSGRRPPKSLVALSQWYNGLSENDKEMLRHAISIATYGAIFDIFTILDHVSFIEASPERGIFELYYVKDGQRTLLNPQDGEFLHDLFNMVAYPYEL